MSAELDRVALEGEIVSETPSWEDHVTAFISAEQEISERRWMQARIAASVSRIFGRSSMKEFARDVKLSKTTVYEMARVWWCFGHLDARPENLDWRHYVEALRAGDPMEAIEEASRDDLTTRQLTARIKEAEEPENVERVQTRVCEVCNGTGEVPVER